MHSDYLELEKRMIDGQYLPKKYFNISGSRKVVQSLAVTSKENKQFIFAGTNQGLYRSGDSGQTWVKLEQGLYIKNIQVLTVSPDDSQAIYAGTPNGIFKSENHGENWKEWFDEASGLTNTFINDILIDPKDSDIIYAATQGGLFVSEGGGDFWAPAGDGLTKNQDVRTIRFSANHPDQLLVGTEAGVLRSTSGNQQWEKKWDDALPKSITSLVTLKTDPEFTFIGTDDGLYKSFNGGLNWTKDKSSRLNEVRSLAVDSRGQSVIYMTSGNGIFLSKNSGDSWQEITPEKTSIQKGEKATATEFQGILFQARSPTHPPLLLTSSDIGLFISNDNGKLWSFIDFGESITTISKENFKMDVAKLVTEIHTGRFFGTYFFWLVDISTVGLIALAFSGLMIVIYRNKIKKGKTTQRASKDEELKVDKIIEIAESVDDLLVDSKNIHDMVEHVNNHLEKCKSIYSISKEKEELEKVEKHIIKVDQKVHQLLEHIDAFGRLTQDFGIVDSSSLKTKTNQEQSKGKNTEF